MARADGSVYIEGSSRAAASRLCSRTCEGAPFECGEGLHEGSAMAFVVSAARTSSLGHHVRAICTLASALVERSRPGDSILVSLQAAARFPGSEATPCALASVRQTALRAQSLVHMCSVYANKAAGAPPFGLSVSANTTRTGWTRCMGAGQPQIPDCATR